MPAERIYGMLAEFADGEALKVAAGRFREEGYRHMDAYTPFPVHGLAEALGMQKTHLPLIVAGGGLLGGLGGYLMQYWGMAIDYPFNVGGRPPHSWPSFIPVTFELTILAAALAAVIGMFVLNGLPQPYHPVFNEPRFGMASRDRFFLCVQTTDPKYDRRDTRALLEELGARFVREVPK